MVHKWFPDKDKQGYFRQLKSGIGILELNEGFQRQENTCKGSCKNSPIFFLFL